MSDFLKKFLLEDPRRLSSSGRFVALAAFGKHPGWDDHVEDLGLATEALNFAKLILYVNGIGGQIDSGAWEKLEAAQQLPGFAHLFLWQRSGQILVGRMWSSSDGKGRKRYPMVVCLHFTGVPLAWALKQALPILAEVEQGCVGTTSADEVRSLLARKRAALREAVHLADGRGEYAPVSPDALNQILSPADSAKREGYLRVLYQVQSQLGGFAPGVFNVRSNPNSLRVQQIRVPRASSNPDQSLLFWTRFFLVFVDSSAPLLLTLPFEADWLDATIGEPESHELFCLRATPKAVPLVSEVPYKLDDDFRAKASAFLQGFQRAEIPGIPDWKPAVAQIPAAPQPARGGFLKWLGVGLFLVLGAVAAFIFLPKNLLQQGPTSSASQGKADVLVSATNSQDSALSNSANVAAAKQQADLDAQAEANRLAEEKKKSDAVAAAARLKAETEAAAKQKERQEAEAAAKEQDRLRAEAAQKEELERKQAEAAAKERERQAAETARIAAEKKAAEDKELEEQQTKAAQLVSLKPAPADQLVAKTGAVVASTVTHPLSTPATASSSAGAEAANQMTNSIGMVLVLVPSGFWVGKYEVTQAEYTQVMKSNPSNPKWRSDQQPVQQVTWNDAVEFTRKLNELERASVPAGKAYSLPTEKQWKEFAADQKFGDLPGGTAIRKDPVPVGSSGPPNRLGLCDVLGNLWEWCLDDAPGDQKLLKGGAFNSNNYDRTLRPDAKSLSCGFRCVLGPVDNH